MAFEIFNCGVLNIVQKNFVAKMYEILISIPEGIFGDIILKRKAFTPIFGSLINIKIASDLQIIWPTTSSFEKTYFSYNRIGVFLVKSLWKFLQK